MIAAVVGMAGVLVITIDRYWKISAPNPGYEMQMMTSYHFGLWHQCETSANNAHAGITLICIPFVNMAKKKLLLGDFNFNIDHTNIYRFILSIIKN